MSFNIGELVGTITVDSNIEASAGEVIDGIRTIASKGASAGAAAGKAIGDALKIDTSSVDKALDGIKKTLDQQTGAVTKNTRAWAANEIGADKLRDLEKLGVETRDYIDAVSGVPEAQARMQRALEGNADALKELDRLTGQVSQAQNDLATESRAVGGALEEASNGADGFGASVEGFSEKLDGVVGKIRELASGGKGAALAAGAIIGTGLALAISAAFDMDNVTRQIEASLGSTAADSARYGKTAGQLFASNYGDSLEEVGQAVSSVVKNIGGLGQASTEVLGHITSEVINVAKAFDEDFNAVTRSAGQLMKTGLAKNAQEAMDLITAGFQSPVNAADDFLDTIDEYSTVFRSMGLSGKDALGILSQGLKGGARDADVVADSLKEMLLRIQDGSSAGGIKALGLNFTAASAAIAKGGESAKTATDLIIDQLNKVEDPATKSALAVQIFGTKAEDMQKALGSIDVDKAGSQFEAAYGKIQGAADGLDKTLSGSLQAGFESVTRAAQGLVSQAGQFLAPAITVAAGAFSLLFDILSGALTFLLNLPGPLYAIGAAVAIWASWGTIAAGAEALALAIKGIGVAIQGTIAKMGVIGVVLTAVGVGLAFLMDSSDDASKAIEAQQSYLEGLKSTLDETSGAITAATAAQVKKNAVDSGMAATLSSAGISLQLYTQASLGNVDAQEQLAAAVDKARGGVLSTDGAFKGLGATLAGAKVSQDDLTKALATGDWTDVTQKVDAYAQTQGDANVQVGTTTAIMDQFTAAMDGARDPVAALDKIMAGAGDTAHTLAEDQADAAAMTVGTSDAAAAAYDNLLALATVGGLSADAIQQMGTQANLTAPQITAIQQAAAGATEAATPLSEALASGTSAAQEMDSAIQQLQLALDTLAGGEISAEQAGRAHEAAIRAVGAAARDQAAAQAALGDAQAKQTELQNTGTASSYELEAAQRAVDDATAAVADSSDKQADSLDALADSAEGMTQRSFEGAGGMANYDAAVAAATATMAVQRQKFIDSAVAANIGQTAAEQLADAQGLIPANVSTAYDAIRVQQAKDAAGGVTSAVNSVPTSHTTDLNVNDNASGGIASVSRAIASIPDTKTVRINQVTQVTNLGGAAVWTGGQVGPTVQAWRAAQGFSGGGQVPGIPDSNPTVDNVMASVGSTPIKLRSREWIQPEPAVDFYGEQFMRDVQFRRFPKPKGYAGGGSASGGSGDGGGPGSSSFVANVYLDGELIAARAELVVDGRLAEVRSAIKTKQGQRV